ncbi:MAG TPA: DUF5005 domain-containing protein [Verrucomicrobiae bacterium]|nr:DUF5005 domain-containing protein [Verrucomicrobiae bacterium]
MTESFRQSRRAKVFQALLAGALVMLAFGAGAQILTNGGYESGLTGWTNFLSSGGSAAFAKDSIYPRKGTNALRVTVSNPGSASNSVRTVSASFNASSTNTYVLRFWANTDTTGAKLGVNFVGATPVYPQISFIISTNSLASGDQHYQEYLYAFKASGAVSVAFNFQSAAVYWLDDVEILDVANNDGFDVPMTYLWQWGQWNFAQTNSLKIGWTGGDNDKSALLPDGSVAWMFNDSFSSTLSSFYSNIRGGSSLPRNALLHQIGTNLVYENDGNNPYFLPNHVVDNQMPLNPDGLYWIAGAIAGTNKLYVLLNGLNNSPLSNVCMAVATLSLPNLTLDGVVTNLTSPGTDNFGDLVKGDDGFYYIYNAAKVARVPAEQLAVDSAWRYWNGSAWVTDHTQNVAIPNFQGWSITRLAPSNYVAVYHPVLSLDIYAQFAPTPMGPWTGDVKIATAGNQGAQGIFGCYMPNICAGTGSNGVYTIGYSDNGGDTEGWFTKLNNDKSWYNPHFVTANLLQLSPYTPPSGPNLALNKTVVVSSIDNGNDPGPYAVDGNMSTRWSSAYSDPQWIYVDLGSIQSIGQVRLSWETAYGKSYRIDVSNDASTWTTVFTQSNGSGGKEILNFPSLTARYVRMYGTQRGTGWGYSLWEMEVYAPYAPLSTPVSLGLQQLEGNLVFTWPQGILLQATNVLGPWTTNGASSPYTNQPNNPQMFYRVLVQ